MRTECERACRQNGHTCLLSESTMRLNTRAVASTYWWGAYATRLVTCCTHFADSDGATLVAMLTQAYCSGFDMTRAPSATPRGRSLMAQVGLDEHVTVRIRGEEHQSLADMGL